MTTVSPDKDERHCSTCGATDPQENEFCSNGFHAPGETYWPTPDKDEVERVARALCKSHKLDPDRQIASMLDGQTSYPQWAAFSTHARRAIAAMSPVDRLRKALDDLADRVSDDDCAICGKSKSQHHTGSGYGVCQIYPCFVSKRTIFQRIGDAALSSPESVGEVTNE